MNPTHLRSRVTARSIPRPYHRPSTQPHAPLTLYLSQTTPKPRPYSTPSLPRIAQPSFWAQLVPKFLRSPSSPSQRGSTPSPQPAEWNPATFYIIIFLLIGSQAIRMIMLKNEYSAYTRSTDAKIRLLREVIQKVKDGEQVDVERLLGRGDEGVEREWEEVLKEIEQEDSLWHQQKQKAKRDKAEEEERAEADIAAKAKADTQAQSQESESAHSSTATNAGDELPAKPKRRVGFF
ncbi:hypothetical protein BJX70DRAFT_374171 [Aspergillus crustosus]